MQGLLIAAAHSGAGKTTLTLGLLGALRRRGVRVRAAKSGPDYIDPAFHAAATGAPSYNLDTWAMPPAVLDALVGAGDGAELLVVESAMGLFDGVAAPSGRSGASADLAARFGLPVVLVLDVSAQSQTAAAVAHGLATYREGVTVAGVVLNNVSGERHAAPIAAELARRGIPVLGVMSRDPALRLPERHLGLVQAGEQPELAARLALLADAAERGLRLDAILTVARDVTLGERGVTAITPPGQRIAIARDAAFSFLYPHLLNGWRRAGAEIAFFSPLADEAPPAACDVCWLPGGYPELHAATLSNASRFQEGLRAFASRAPVHGECGGYMVLGEALVDADGVSHRMAGLLSHTTSYAERRLHIGYRDVTLLHDGVLGAAETRVRGHEFHYACVTDPGHDAPFAEMRDSQGKALGPSGGRRGLVSGSFFHFIAAPSAAENSPPRSS